MSNDQESESKSDALPEPDLVFQVRKVTVIGYAVYKCIECRTQAPGDRKITVEEESGRIPTESELVNHITPAEMPVGWSSYGRSVYKCPTCSDF